MFGRILAGAVLARTTNAARNGLIQRGGPVSNLNLQRRYRADAEVLMLGMSMLRREGVGGGNVLWRESEAGTDRLLEFTGFSEPEHAAGLSRFGLIREQARLGENGCTESAYFGLMTSAKEESANDAKKALHSNAKQQAYTVIDGKIGAGETKTATAHFTAPVAVSVEHRKELVERARQALATTGQTAARPTEAEVSQSFLQALADLLRRPDATSGRYSYGGRPYHIRLSRSADQKAAASFQEKGLIPSGTEVIRVSGRVRRVAGGKDTEFRLWIPAGSDRPLPLRIEYQPKSYLRLTFEAQA